MLRPISALHVFGNNLVHMSTNFSPLFWSYHWKRGSQSLRLGLKDSGRRAIGWEDVVGTLESGFGQEGWGQEDRSSRCRADWRPLTREASGKPNARVVDFVSQPTVRAPFYREVVQPPREGKGNSSPHPEPTSGRDRTFMRRTSGNSPRVSGTTLPCSTSGKAVVLSCYFYTVFLLIFLFCQLYFTISQNYLIFTSL
jgi:hypothetical protein